MNKYFTLTELAKNRRTNLPLPTLLLFKIQYKIWISIIILTLSQISDKTKISVISLIMVCKIITICEDWIKKHIKLIITPLEIHMVRLITIKCKILIITTFLQLTIIILDFMVTKTIKIHKIVTLDFTLVSKLKTESHHLRHRTCT